MQWRTIALAFALCGLACRPSPQPSDPPPTTETAEVTETTPPPTTPPAERSPIPAEINRRYEEETDPKAWVERFEREGREVHDRRDDIVAALGIKPGMAVADVGAGTGLFTLELARAVGPKGKVVAVDVQGYFLRHIAEKAEAAGLKNIDGRVAVQWSPNLDAGEVDLVFMCDAFHHVEHPGPYLESIREALKPGGRFALVDYRNEPGVSKWMRDHIRASPAGFREEVEAAGLTFVEEVDLLEENFFYVFERPR